MITIRKFQKLVFNQITTLILKIIKIKICNFITSLIQIIKYTTAKGFIQVETLYSESNIGVAKFYLNCEVTLQLLIIISGI